MVAYNSTRAEIETQNRVLQEWRQREAFKMKTANRKWKNDLNLKAGDCVFITEYGIVIERKEQNG